MADLTRRALLGGVAALPLACGPGSPESELDRANRLHHRPLPRERVRAIVPAFRMNRAFFRGVRELEIDDLVEPAVRFTAR